MNSGAERRLSIEVNSKTALHVAQQLERNKQVEQTRIEQINLLLEALDPDFCKMESCLYEELFVYPPRFVEVVLFLYLRQSKVSIVFQSAQEFKEAVDTHGALFTRVVFKQPYNQDLHKYTFALQQLKYLETNLDCSAIETFPELLGLEGFCIEYQNHEPKEIQSILKKTPNIQELMFKNIMTWQNIHNPVPLKNLKTLVLDKLCEGSLDNMTSFFDQFPVLQNLTFSRYGLSSLPEFTKTKQNLRSLTVLNGKRLSSDALSTIFLDCPFLEKLELDYCSNLQELQLPEKDCTLKELSLVSTFEGDHELLSRVINQNPGLEKLSVCDSKIDDLQLSRVLEQLRVLKLWGLQIEDTDAFIQFLNQAPNIEELDLRFCKSSAKVRLPRSVKQSLKKIALIGWNITLEKTLFLTELSQLTHLDISGRGVKSILDIPNLQKLEVLKLNGCKNLSAHGVKSIKDQFPKLKKLIAHHTPSLNRLIPFLLRKYRDELDIVF